MEGTGEVNVEGDIRGANNLNDENENENEDEEQIDEEEERQRREELQRIKETLFGLPTNIILKLIQNKIDLQYYKIRKESIQTLSRCLSVFILYITDCALEHAEHDKRSTIQTQDILAALDESLFIDIAEELKDLIAQDDDLNKKTGRTTNILSNNNLNVTDKKEVQNKTSDGKDDFDILLDALE